MINKPNSPKLVLIAATRKELPIDWFQTLNIPILTKKSLYSGGWNRFETPQPIVVIISGVGWQNATETANWILSNWIPKFIVNIGACGSSDPNMVPGQWVIPQIIRNGTSKKIKIDTRLPFYWPTPVTINTHPILETIETPATSPLQQPVLVDMEAYFLATQFEKSPASFHCLKFITDQCDNLSLNSFNTFIKKMQSELPTLLECFNPPTNDIAIIIPTHNRACYLEKCLKSVLAQHLKPKQIIVVDDGSTDNTTQVLAQFESKITVIKSMKNRGVSWARNEGISKANSTWIALLDSDDWWAPEKLIDQYHYSKIFPFYPILQSEEIWIRNGKRVNACKQHEKKEGWIFKNCLDRCLISPSSVLIHKSILKNRPFDESLPACEDYDLWLKLTRQYPVGLSCKQTLFKTGGHPDQLSQKYPAMDQFRIQSLLKALKSEHDPIHANQIRTVLHQKLDILINGGQKRGHTKEVAHFTSIKHSLEPDISQQYTHPAVQ